MNHDNRSQAGFTIIELTLAMTFISVLLLAIALTIIQIGAVYNRGMLLKEVNQVSRTVSDDVRRTLSGGNAFALDTDYKAFPNVGGRLCTGSYSYVWNVGAKQSTSETNVLRYAAGSSKASSPVRLVKLVDTTKSYCAVNTSGVLTKTTIPAGEQAAARELISAGERELAIHSFRVTSGADALDVLTGQRLYSIAFVIGTNNQPSLKADATGEKTSCVEPGQPGADPLYCVVRDFTVVVKTGNRF